jgi:glycosyltransferase 2 family protein
MRRLLFVLIFFVGVLFIMARIAEVQTIAETMQRGDWRYVLLAVGLVSLWLLTVAFSYKAIYSALGLNEQVKLLLPMASAAIFLNVVAPSAGMSGMAVFIAQAKRQKYSTGKAAVAGALFVLLDYGAFFCVLALGLIVLFRRNSLDAGEIFATVILLIISLTLLTLIFLGMRSAQSLGRALAWMARLVNRLLRPVLKRKYLSEKRAYEFAGDAGDGLRVLLKSPQRLVIPVGLALLKQAMLIGILWCSFMIFQVPYSAGTLIAGFSIGYLFMIVTPTPAGLGFVEGALTLALTSMYIPFSAAAIVTLAYRGFTFWIPLLVGMVAFRILEGMNHVVQRIDDEFLDLRPSQE